MEFEKYNGIHIKQKIKQIHVVLPINPHMHKLGPRGPTHYIFGD